MTHWLARASRLAFSLILLTASLAGCSDEEGSSTASDVDEADAVDAPDDQNQPDQGQPDQGQPDQGQPDQGQPDQGQPDAVPDQADDDVTIVDVGPSGCSVDTSGLASAAVYDDGSGGSRQVLLAIEAIDFDNDIVFIRNVSNLTGSPRAVAFDTDWRLAHNISGAALGSARDLPAGGRMAIHLRDSGLNTAQATFLELGGGTWNLTPCGGEIVIQNRSAQSTAEWSNNPGNIEAFVRWGSRPAMGATSTFNDEAFEAGAWAVDLTAEGNAIPTCWSDDEGVSWCGGAATCAGMDNHVGLVATGDVENPEDWVSASSTDFANCP